MIRRAETDADLASYCEVWNAITPREPNELETVKRRLGGSRSASTSLRSKATRS